MSTTKQRRRAIDEVVIFTPGFGRFPVCPRGVWSTWATVLGCRTRVMLMPARFAERTLSGHPSARRRQSRGDTYGRLSSGFATMSALKLLAPWTLCAATRASLLAKKWSAALPAEAGNPGRCRGLF